jgi:hypothetical protein
LLTYAIMLDLLIVMCMQFVIMVIELETVLIVQKTLNANNLKKRLFVCVARMPQCYWNEQYRKLWLIFDYIFIALEISKCIV